MSTVNSDDGTEIAWYDWGGDGPDLFFAHATGFCAAVWQPVLDVLVPHFHCVGYDMRGHGHSASPSTVGGWDWNRYADDAAAVIKDACLEEPFGVGHSCGGTTELLVEQRSPGSFRGLYVFEPVLFTDEPPLGPDPDRHLAVRTRRRRRSFTSRQEALENFSNGGPFAGFDSRTISAYVDEGFARQADGTLVIRCDPDDEAEVYVQASAHDAFSHLGNIGCPVTVAHGGSSMSFTASHMAEVAKRIPAGSFADFSDLGHFGPLEDPQRVALAMLRTIGQGP